MKKLEKDNFNETIKNGFWIADFYADWCGPCKMLSPVLESLNYENIIKVNVDSHQELASSYGVMSIPTLKFFVNGEEKDTLVGFHSSEEIQEVMNKYM